MKVKKIIGVAAIVFFCACAIFSGVVFVHQYKDAKNSAEQFENLTDLISEVDTSVLEPTHEDNETDNGEANSEEPVPELTDEARAALEAELAKERYNALFEQNSDFVGWISIEGTNINYPVMWTPNNPDFYLKHSFEKEYRIAFRVKATIM